MQWPAVLAWRMRRQQLTERAPARRRSRSSPGSRASTRRSASSADAALRARVDGLEEDVLARALWQDRTLVKTWAMRGTLHLLVREELPTYLGALSRLRRATTSRPGCAATASRASRWTRCSPRSRRSSPGSR